MFALQTMDLYHIETDREGGYIEWMLANASEIYRAEPSEAYRQIPSVDTDAVLVKKRGHRTQKRSMSFFVGRYHILINLKLSFRVQPYLQGVFCLTFLFLFVIMK